jgi:hypothetical protein
MPDLVQQIRWTGTVRGFVKTLPAFNKKFHTVPDAATPVTNEFLAKLYAPELAADAEAFFQKIRAALRYKRAEITLSASGACAVLATKNFTLEWACALDPADPSEWVRTHTLHGVTNRDLLGVPEFDELFPGAFSSLEFLLTKPVKVEDIIDTVEALETDGAASGSNGNSGNDGGGSTAGSGNGGNAGTGKSAGTGKNAAEKFPFPTVEYPSNCASCTLRVEGVPATVEFSGDLLRMDFPHPGTPNELAIEFDRLRRAFDLTHAAPFTDLW